MRKTEEWIGMVVINLIFKNNQTILRKWWITTICGSTREIMVAIQPTNHLVLLYHHKRLTVLRGGAAQHFSRERCLH